jgi:hypothetical protein
MVLFQCWVFLKIFFLLVGNRKYGMEFLSRAFKEHGFSSFEVFMAVLIQVEVVTQKT